MTTALTWHVIDGHTYYLGVPLWNLKDTQHNRYRLHCLFLNEECYTCFYSHSLTWLLKLQLDPKFNSDSMVILKAMLRSVGVGVCSISLFEFIKKTYYFKN
jgi:hypothetical protein